VVPLAPVTCEVLLRQRAVSPLLDYRSAVPDLDLPQHLFHPVTYQTKSDTARGMNDDPQKLGVRVRPNIRGNTKHYVGDRGHGEVHRAPRRVRLRCERLGAEAVAHIGAVALAEGDMKTRGNGDGRLLLEERDLMCNMQVRLVVVIHERVQLNRNVIQRSINDHFHRDHVLDAEHGSTQPAQVDVIIRFRVPTARRDHLSLALAGTKEERCL
jgi:hypothetical protein